MSVLRAEEGREAQDCEVLRKGRVLPTAAESVDGANGLDCPPKHTQQRRARRTGTAQRRLTGSAPHGAPEEGQALVRRGSAQGSRERGRRTGPAVRSVRPHARARPTAG